VTVIDGRVGRKTSNALTIGFHAGPGDPFAVGVQGARDSRAKKLGTLFGFKNGGVGNHELRFADGSVVRVASRDGKPSEFSDGSGAPLASVQRGDTSVALLPDGREIVRFIPDAQEPATADLFRMVVTDPADAEIGRLDVIRRTSGWTLASLIDEALMFDYWLDHAGESLPLPILGTRLQLTGQLSDTLRQVLLAACVDIAIGLRPYTKEMS
jgi:hypothetical protein